MHVPPIFVSLSAGEAELAQWASSLPKPRGILVVSALWRAGVLTRGSTARTPPIVDATDIAYRAPGAPELAYDLASLVAVERSDRGWDLGVVEPLTSMYPRADVPVLELAAPSGATPRALYALGRKIGPLAARGYLLAGTGHVTYDGASLAEPEGAETPDWARGFDAWVANQLADAEAESILGHRSIAPASRRAPRPSDHIDPLFVIMGAASLRDHGVGFPVRGFSHGTNSRRCVQFGALG